MPSIKSSWWRGKLQELEVKGPWRRRKISRKISRNLQRKIPRLKTSSKFWMKVSRNSTMTWGQSKTNSTKSEAQRKSWTLKSKNSPLRTTWPFKISPRSTRKKNKFWFNMTSWSWKSRRSKKIWTELLITYTASKTRKINWRWVCNKERRKFSCIEMSCWPNRKLSKMKGTESPLNLPKGKTKSRTSESSMSLWSKRHVYFCLFRWLGRWIGWTFPGLLCHQGLPVAIRTSEKGRRVERKNQQSWKGTERTAEHHLCPDCHQWKIGPEKSEQRHQQIRPAAKRCPWRTVQRSQWKFIQEKRRTKKIRSRIRTRRKKTNRNPEPKRNPQGKKSQIRASYLQAKPWTELVPRKKGPGGKIPGNNADSLGEEENLNSRGQSPPCPTLVRPVVRQKQNPHPVSQVRIVLCRNLG